MNHGDLAQLAQATEFDKELLDILHQAPLAPPDWPLTIWPCPPLQSLSTDEIRLLARFWRGMRAHEAELRQKAGFTELDLSLRDIALEATSARRYLRLFVAPPQGIKTRA